MMNTKTNIPQLRFSEFNEEWEEKKLGDLGHFQGGGTPDTTEDKYWNGVIPWISSSDLVDNDIKNIKISRWINEISIKESATKLIPKDSILFVSRVGVGKLAIAYTDLCTSQDFTNLTLKKDNSQYVGYYFLANKTLLLRYSQGTSIKGFTTNDIKTLKLHLPSKLEQEKIASFLSSVDTKREQLTKKKTLLEHYKKGVMQKIFSREIRFKDDDGSEYPEWVEKKLGDLCEVAKSGGTPTSTNKKYYDGDIPFLAISDMTSQGKYLTKTSKTISQDGIDNSASWVLPVGTIIYSMYASVGFVAINKIPIATSQAVINLRLKKDISTEFIYYSLVEIKKIIHKFIETGTQGNLNAQTVKSLKVSLPSLKEQAKIANFLSSIDSKIEQSNKQLNSTNQFKKALLQQMFM